MFGPKNWKVLPMDDDEFFDAQFPGSAARLRELRAQDEEFDRICQEYLELFSELTRTRSSGSGTQLRYVADLAESLSDLRGSIDAKLQSAVLTKVGPPSPQG